MFWAKKKIKIEKDGDGLKVIARNGVYRVRKYDTFIRGGKQAWYIYDKHGETVVGDIGSKEELEEFLFKL